MKIIGETTNGFIAEIGKDEAYNLAGLYGQYGRKPNDIEIKIGTVFKVAEIYTLYGKIRIDDGERKRIAENLRAAATVLENTPSILVQPKEEST